MRKFKYEGFHQWRKTWFLIIFLMEENIEKISCIVPEKRYNVLTLQSIG